MESLNKKDMTEIKSYGRPPALVETVMQAVMILRGNEPTWAEAKRQLGEAEGRQGRERKEERDGGIKLAIKWRERWKKEEGRKGGGETGGDGHGGG